MLSSDIFSISVTTHIKQLLSYPQISASDSCFYICGLPPQTVVFISAVFHLGQLFFNYKHLFIQMFFLLLIQIFRRDLIQQHFHAFFPSGSTFLTA